MSAQESVPVQCPAPAPDHAPDHGPAPEHELCKTITLPASEVIVESVDIDATLFNQPLSDQHWFKIHLDIEQDKLYSTSTYSLADDKSLCDSELVVSNNLGQALSRIRAKIEAGKFTPSNQINNIIKRSYPQSGYIGNLVGGVSSLFLCGRPSERFISPLELKKLTDPNYADGYFYAELTKALQDNIDKLVPQEDTFTKFYENYRKSRPDDKESECGSGKYEYDLSGSSISFTLNYKVTIKDESFGDTGGDASGSLSEYFSDSHTYPNIGDSMPTVRAKIQYKFLESYLLMASAAQTQFKVGYNHYLSYAPGIEGESGVLTILVPLLITLHITKPKQC